MEFPGLNNFNPLSLLGGASGATGATGATGAGGANPLQGVDPMQLLASLFAKQTQPGAQAQGQDQGQVCSCGGGACKGGACNCGCSCCQKNESLGF